MFKKIKDERLVLRNLKDIRIAFVIQTIGIIAILVYTGVTDGVRAIMNHPLWIVFMITVIVLSFLSMRISVDMEDHEDKQKKPKPYYWTVILSIVIGAVVGLLTRFGPDHGSTRDALIMGSVIFICFLMSFTIAHYLRKKRYEDHLEDKNR